MCATPALRAASRCTARAVPAAGSVPPGRYRSLSVKKRLQEAEVGFKRCLWQMEESAAEPGDPECVTPGVSVGRQSHPICAALAAAVLGTGCCPQRCCPCLHL
ncbi:unnamed protein product [Coccothraustes coccothraustes]